MNVPMHMGTVSAMHTHCVECAVDVTLFIFCQGTACYWDTIFELHMQNGGATWCVP